MTLFGKPIFKMDLYIFARALFNKKLLAAGLEAQNPTLWQVKVHYFLQIDPKPAKYFNFFSFYQYFE